MRKSSTRFWSSPALTLKPGRSAGLGWLTLVLCAAGAACVLASALPLWLALPVCLLVFLGGIAQFARLHRYCSAGQVDALVFERGRWLLHLCSGARFPLELAATPLLCEHVMAACFQHPGRRNCAYRVFLLPDMIDMESWRRTALALRQDEPGKSG